MNGLAGPILLLWLVGGGIPAAAASVAGEVLPPERRTVWDPGIPGGIPARTTVCATVDAADHGNGLQDATTSIQAALDNCPDDQVVQLSAGDFLVAGEFPVTVNRSVVLRGMGPSATRLTQTTATANPVILIGERWLEEAASVDLTADASKGATSVDVSTAAGFGVGELVLLTELTDDSYVYWGKDPEVAPGGEGRGWFTRYDRPLGQMLEIASITGNSVSFTTALHITFDTAHNAQLTRYTMPYGVKYAGVEDLSVRGGQDDNITMRLAMYSWIKNVESDWSTGDSIALDRSLRCVVRDSYVHGAPFPSPGGGGNLLSVSEYTADSLVENNIFIHGRKVMLMRASGGGNVIGYNYFDNGYLGSAPDWMESGLTASRVACPHFELFEGNQAFNIDGDDTWGGAVYNTFFRNHATGKRRSFTDVQDRRAIGVMSGHYYYSFVGNVLGTEDQDPTPFSGFAYEDVWPWQSDPIGMWRLGYTPADREAEPDARVVDTTYRHGNFDYATQGVVWDASNPNQDLPDSLYLTSKPAFFGDNPWPWVDPTGAVKLHTLPARARYDSADVVPPVVVTPEDATLEAAGPEGAAFPFSASATDNVDGIVPVACFPASESTFPLGTTTVHCTATDARDNVGSASFTVTVTDTTPPALAVPADVALEATEPSGIVVHYHAAAFDTVDGDVAVTCNPASGSIFPPGVTTVLCTATDAHGNTGSASFSVTATDTTTPVVTVPANAIVEATGPTGAAFLYTAYANDIIAGLLPVICIPASGATFPLGTTTVGCTAIDFHGNLGAASFTVTVTDTTAPVVIVPASVTLEASGPSGAAYTVTATAMDSVDGAIPVACDMATGTTFPLGTTTVSCSATDTRGNTGAASFTVTVRDTTPPAVTVPADASLEVDGPAVAFGFGASATDTVDSAVVATCTPPPGSAFPVGTTTVFCLATDSSGNRGSASFRVTVTDTRPPVFPPERRTAWNPGVPGGVPVRTTVCATVEASAYGNGLLEATTAIQAALDTCPEGQVVQLSAGNFLVAGEFPLTINRSVVLRGMGPDATRLTQTTATANPVIVIGERWFEEAASVDLTADAPKGANTVEVSTAAGFNVGDLVLLTELTDDSYVSWGKDPAVAPGGEGRGWFTRYDRPVGQMLEIASLTGNAISFTTPVHIGFDTAHAAQLTRHTVPYGAKYAGVEDLYVRGGQDDNISMRLAMYSWIKNVESDWSTGDSIALDRSFRSVVRDSYVHDTPFPSPGGGGYLLSVSEYTADSLIENNTFIRGNKVMVMRASGGGNVIGYNYFDNGYIDYALGFVETGLNASHLTCPHFELFEGNQAFNIDGDDTWGGSVYNTFFRNHSTGKRRSFTDVQDRRAIGLMYGHYYYSFVGNVLGAEDQDPTPFSGFAYEDVWPWQSDPIGLWRLGYTPTDREAEPDARVVDTTYRHGNFDYATQGVVWDASNPNQDLPDSLYLTSKPAFFGDNPWPWVDPTGAVKLHTLPARARYDGADPLPPVVVGPGAATVEAAGPEGAAFQFNASATDNVDGIVPVACVPASGSTFPLGTTTVRCTATDARDNVGSVSFTVTVTDTTPPLVTAPAEVVLEAAGPAGRVFTYSASALDIVDGVLPVACLPASGSTFPVTATLVTCLAIDAHSNTGTASFTVTVRDVVAPVLTVPPDATLEATGPAGAVFVFTATATDDIDEDVPPTCLPASGSSFPLGATTVACTATDAHGNSGSASFRVTVTDTTAPIVTVPADATLEAAGPAGAIHAFVASATDLVDGVVPVTCLPSGGATFPLGATTVHCTATDLHGNPRSASFTVTVRDTTAPAITVPAHATIEATSANGAVFVYAAAATDSVDGAVSVTCEPATGSIFPLATTTVTCTSTDARGNIGSASFTVKVVDTIPPVVTVPANVTIEATGPAGAAVSYAASATDHIDGVLAASCAPSSGSSFPVGLTPVTCSATDAHGNVGMASFTVTVVDTVPPVVTVPPNVTLEATGPAGATFIYVASATDLVDGAVAAACSAVSGSTFPLGTTTVTCTATDFHTNTKSASFTVTVRDTTAPVVTVPANATIEATGPAGVSFVYLASATDLVDGAAAASCNPISGSTFPLGATTVTCTATDTRGNPGSASFTVTVQDKTTPVVTVPANVTIEATGPAGVVHAYLASATDTVDGVVTATCMPTSGSTFPLGTTTVTCTATDTRGNPGSASFTVTVGDTTAPVVTAPANATIEATGPAGAVHSYVASATDTVDGVVSAICVPVSGSTFLLGTTTVTCTATDTRGNPGSASFTVTVRDTTAPVVTAPANATIEATGPAGAVHSYVASATDTVDGVVSAICVPVSGSTFPLGTTTVTCTATDTRGNPASASFTVMVQDTTAPIVTVPANVTIEATGPAGAVHSYVASATDTVDGVVTAICVPVSGSTFLLGTTTVTCTATDTRGNPGSASFTVTVQDTTTPVVTVPANATIEATGPAGAVHSYVASATDTVDGVVTATCVPVSGSTFLLGTTTVTCTATDTRGNPGSASFTVTVRDTTAPVVTAPANATIEATGPTGAVHSYVASATDTVDGVVSAICVPVSGSTFLLGTTTVTCTATDTRGNPGSASFTVTVRDTTAPVVTAPANATIEATGPAGAVHSYVASATDTVDGVVTATCVPVSGSTFLLGTTTVTCTATDTRGNPGSAPFTVTVRDTTAPVVTAPANVTIEATGPAGVVHAYLASATDTVDGVVTATCMPTSGSTFPLGTTTVTCTATDTRGNPGSASFTVTVRDTTAPVVTAPANATIEATGPAGAVHSYVASATDTVDGVVTATCTPTSGSTFPLGTTTVTCTATDTRGNPGSASFTVTVQDTTTPVVTVPTNATIEATGPAGATFIYVASATDLVDGAVVATCNPLSGLIFQLGTTTVTCTATDAHGNTGSASFTVTVTLDPLLLFTDGFDAGLPGSWSTLSADDGDLSVSTAAGMNDTLFGLQGVVDDTTGIFVQDDTPQDESSYRARFFFDPNGFDPGETAAHFRTRIFIAFEEAPNRRLATIVLRRKGGHYALMGRAQLDDQSRADTGFFPITDGPHAIEFAWRRSSAPDANDGSFQLWIDGIPVATLTGLDNSASSIDFVRMGALSVKTAASGTLYWDEFESRRLDVEP